MSIKTFTYNTRNNTKVGDFVESLTKDLFLKDGFYNYFLKDKMVTLLI